MTNANPEPYSERVRLAEIISDARKLVAESYADCEPGREVYVLAARVGNLEAMLKALADSAEIVASGKPEG